MEITKLLNELETLGFYRFLLPQQIPTVKHAQLRDRSLFIMYSFLDQGHWHLFPEVGRKRNYEMQSPEGSYDPTRRSWFMDAEDLAEARPHEWLIDHRSALNLFGCSFIEAHSEWTENNGNRLTIDGTAYQLFDRRERQELGLGWALDTERLFSVINHRLSLAGVDDRLYQWMGGNDQQGVFLTPSMRKIIVPESLHCLYLQDSPYDKVQIL
jgi:hypothetical protein